MQGNPTQGVSLVLGADTARVFDSALLPAGGAVTMSEQRDRLRAGVNWQGKRTSVFYGVTYLSPEFEEQDEGQVLGAINLSLRF
jgi:hypothetical protein